MHVDKEEDGLSGYVFKHPLPGNLKCILCGKLFEVSRSLWAARKVVTFELQAAHSCPAGWAFANGILRGPKD